MVKEICKDTCFLSQPSQEAGPEDLETAQDLLDTLRKLCKGRAAPIRELYEAFNKETKDGKDMSGPSALLSAAIDSILHVKEMSDIDSLFSSGGTSALLSDVNGLDDFELICFLMIR